MMQLPGFVLRMFLLADARTGTGYLSRQLTVVVGSMKPVYGIKYPSVRLDQPQLRLIFAMLYWINMASVFTSDLRICIMRQASKFHVLSRRLRALG